MQICYSYFSLFSMQWDSPCIWNIISIKFQSRLWWQMQRWNPVIYSKGRKWIAYRSNCFSSSDTQSKNIKVKVFWANSHLKWRYLILNLPAQSLMEPECLSKTKKKNSNQNNLQIMKVVILSLIQKQIFRSLMSTSIWFQIFD